MKCGFIEGTAYRNNFLTGMIGNFVQVAVLFYVWKSIFSFQEVVNGYTWEIMRKYVFVSFLCNSALSFGFEMQTANKIISGDIIMDLLKPISYRAMTFFKLMGIAGTEFSISLLLIGSLYLAVNGTEGIRPERCLLFLVSLVLGQGIKFNIQYVFSLLCFYTDNAYGILKGREILTNFFSGALIPLTMFPAAIRGILNFSPFSGIVFIPCSIFIGTFGIQEALQGILLQCFWNLVIYLLGKVFWRRASLVLSLYGG